MLGKLLGVDHVSAADGRCTLDRCTLDSGTALILWTDDRWDLDNRRLDLADCFRTADRCPDPDPDVGVDVDVGVDPDVGVDVDPDADTDADTDADADAISILGCNDINVGSD